MKNNLKWWHGGSTRKEPGFYLEFDYDAELIRELKVRIPAYLREWDDGHKRWWVSELCEKPINDLFPGFLEQVVSQKRLF